MAQPIIDHLLSRINNLMEHTDSNKCCVASQDPRDLSGMTDPSFLAWLRKKDKPTDKVCGQHGVKLSLQTRHDSAGEKAYVLMFDDKDEMHCAIRQYRVSDDAVSVLAGTKDLSSMIVDVVAFLLWRTMPAAPRTD